MEKKNGKYHKQLFCCQLSDANDEEQVFDLFLLNSIKYNSNTRGVRWLELKLQDNSGFISGRIWADNIRSEYETYAGKTVFVKGCINYYAGRPEITVELLRPVKEEEFDLCELCRMVQPDVASGYISSIKILISNIQDELLRDYVEHILTDENLQEMATLPVDLHGHHNYRGGLLEHTYEVSFGAFYHSKATKSMRRYPIDLNLVSAGALLHDIDVIKRISHCGYGYRDKAFCGIIGRYPLYDLLSEARWESKLPDDVFSHLLHIIESSHETGVPKTAEAMAVRSANLLSAELNRLEDTLWNRKAENGDPIWSRTLEREVYRFERKEENGDAT